MDYVDIESFRSKYSDLTVTAVPSTSKRNDEQQQASEQEEAKPQEPRVEITRIPGGVAAAPPPINQVMVTRNRTQQSAAALAYANEYKEVMAKLEYTKYMQAQLQLMILANGTSSGGGAGFNGSLFGMMPTTVDENSNIVDKYSDLLNGLAEMQPNLAPTMIGVRTRKDRLLRDIAQARVMVRECILLLENDQQLESEATQSQNSPTSE